MRPGFPRSFRAFEGMLNLVNLDLSENNLTFIPPGAFLTLVALRHPLLPCSVFLDLGPVGPGVTLLNAETDPTFCAN